MLTQVQQEKASARLRVRDRLSRLSAAERVELSASLVRQLHGSELFRRSGSVLFYAPLSDEPDIWPLVRLALSQGKQAALPFYDSDSRRYRAAEIRDCENDVVFGQFGIREPCPSSRAAPVKRLDLILVPGVAFDPVGRRLGRGKGFYDQLLMTMGGTRCGVAFEEQILETIPHEAHDVSLDCVVTPRRWIRLSRERGI